MPSMANVAGDPDPSAYTVGWISAISTEIVAARQFLDREHGSLSNRAPNDNNIYTLGEMAGHNVVIAVLPEGEYGTSSAASVATNMLRTFKNIKIGLMVGVGGGAPSKRNDIRLGDVVVSIPEGGKSGVFQYDYGKCIQGEDFKHTGCLAPPPPLLRAAVNDLKGRFEADGHHIDEDIEAILKDKPRLRKKYSRPEQASDRLYKSHHIHLKQGSSCEDICGNETNLGTNSVVCRRQRDEYEDDPTIHYGLIASSNQLMKDAFLRDDLADKHHILCFEMEAAGLMHNFPCLVIRGICDYSDSHKNKRWQGYSAMTAAAYAKEVLRRIPPALVQAEQSLAMSIHTLDRKLQRISSNTSQLVAEKANDAIIRWLSAPDPTTNYEQALKGLEQNAGSWYFTGLQFTKWRATPKSTLWTTGIPGSGKTCISAAAIRMLHKTCIYFFFDFRDPNKQTLEQLLRALVSQLYSKLGIEISRACDRLRESFIALMEGHELPLNERLYSTLKEMLELETAKNTHIVIDALDESTTQQEIRSFIRSLALECNIRILLTCRNSFYQDWFMEFSLFDLPNIFWQPMTGEGLFEEIETYVQRRVNDGNEAWHPGIPPAQVIAGVCKKANGLFGLAACQLDLLKTCVDEKDLKVELHRMPSSLNEIYSQSLEKIPPIQRSRAMRILSLLVHSPWPLSEKEIKHALAIRTVTGLPWEDELDWRSIKGLVPSLTIETTLEASNVQVQAIQLAHNSVRDFLLSQTACSFWDLTQSKICAARICLTYLLQVSKENKQTIGLFKHQTEAPSVLLTKYPFSAWAARHWMKAAKSQEVQHAVISQLTQLFQDNDAFWFWKAIIRDQVPGNLTGPLGLSSYFDLIMIVKKLLDEGPTDDDITSAFAAVCAQGNWKLAEVLSRSKVTVPSHLLEFASSQGYFKLIKALINEGVEWGLYNDLLEKTILSLSGDYEALAEYLICEKFAQLDIEVDQNFMDVSFRRLCLEKKTKLVQLLTRNGLHFGEHIYHAIVLARDMRAHDIAEFLVSESWVRLAAIPPILRERICASAVPMEPWTRRLITPLPKCESATIPEFRSRAPHQYGYSGTTRHQILASGLLPTRLHSTPLGAGTEDGEIEVGVVEEGIGFYDGTDATEVAEEVADASGGGGLWVYE